MLLDFLQLSMGITSSVIRESSKNILQDNIGSGGAGTPLGPTGYLLLETGDKLILEDGLGFLLLEG